MRRPLALIAATSMAACASLGGPAAVPPITTLAPVAEITADSLLAINALCSAEALGLDKIAPDIKLQAGMGTGGFKVDTTNAEAQRWFDYGLALSHAFYHQDVKAAMKRSVALDPACSLCSWGEAWALGPTLNYGIAEDERVLALAAAATAVLACSAHFDTIATIGTLTNSGTIIAFRSGSIGSATGVVNVGRIGLLQNTGLIAAQG